MACLKCPSNVIFCWSGFFFKALALVKTYLFASMRMPTCFLNGEYSSIFQPSSREGVCEPERHRRVSFAPTPGDTLQVEGIFVARHAQPGRGGEKDSEGG